MFTLKAVTSVHDGYGSALVRLASSATTTATPSLVTSGEPAQVRPVSGRDQISLPVSGSWPTTSRTPALAYTLSVSQEPSTLQTSFLGTSGAGSWKRTFALVLDGTFSEPPPPPAPSSPLSPSLPSVPPGPAEVSLSSSLDEFA